VLSGRFDIGHLAFRQGFGFCLEVDFGIDIRGLQRDMAEPAPDCVDVDASAQKVGRGGVADGVRADTLCRQRRRLGSSLQSVTFNDGMDPESSNRSPAAIEKDWPGRRAFACDGGEF